MVVVNLAPLRGGGGGGGGDAGEGDDGGGGGGGGGQHEHAFLRMRKLGSHGGPQVRTSTRPVSWCIGGLGGAASGPPLGPPREKDPASTRADLARRGLARSSSYQALHTALARLYRIDDFHKERIGSGFFSEVFKVRHRVTGDVMVLKMNKLISNRHNMLREVELMNKLHHPNILSYFGVCVNEGQVHALTEYINGGSLDSLIGNRAVGLPWATRVSLALDIARGMAYLHSQGVFHRDLTSKNVLIKHTYEGGEHKLTAVIADFGLAAPIPHEQCVRLRQVGSPFWMAPEVIRGDWYDHRVDVFSFGIIVCEMIARCEADPDILPRTHNFGVHYVDFYQMCQQDCPAQFLELAFMCCQIEPASRPSFEDITSKLEHLLSQLIAQNACFNARKLKVFHRRSLSDDTFKLLRNQMGEAVYVPTTQHHHTTTVFPALHSASVTPQEIVDSMSAADPYFQPSSGTVNPFAQLKLPARSQLALQEGGRYCYSLPNYLHLLEEPAVPELKHIHTSDSCLCHLVHCQCQSNHRNCSGNLDNARKQCQCLSVRKCKAERVVDCKCKATRSCSEVAGSVWPAEVDVSPGTVLRSELGSSGEATTSVIAGNMVGGQVRRRGSGESGFFSVGDIERMGTPDLCLSYSELSTASLFSAEDEEAGHQCFAQRSSSVVTDSSEDLSSLGCCHDPQNCDLASLCDMDRSKLSACEVDTDIQQIVNFFEQNIGETGMERPRRQSSRLQQGQGSLVPLLTHKFSNLHAGHRLPGPSGGYSCQTHQNGSLLPSNSFNTKDCNVPKVCCLPCLRSERRDTFRVKDRPKVYITEGTVRAKRDIFEAK